MFTLGLISQWRLFKKMGKPGWVSLVPIYNFFALNECLLGSGWLILLYFVPILNFVLLIITAVKLVHGFGKGGWWTVGGVLLFCLPVYLMVFGISDLKFKDGTCENKDYDFVDGIFDFLEGQKYKRRLNRVKIDDNNEIAVCPNCGEAIRDGAKYCYKCGTKIEE